MRSFDKESDRSAAIIAGVVLDEALRDALQETFVDEMSNNEDDRLFEGYGPLSTFSARIDIAFAIGLFGPRTKATFHLLRRVRNEFAHRLGLDFEHPSIAMLCSKLSLDEKGIITGKNNRERYLEYVSWLSNQIRFEAYLSRQTRKKPEYLPL